MGNKSRKNKQNKEIVVNVQNVSESKYVELHAEAYYRALKRIEMEKEESNVLKFQEKKKSNWYEEILFVFNVILFPWKINKHFKINNRVYDSILVVPVSLVLHGVGTITWGGGVLAIIYTIWQCVCKQSEVDWMLVIIIEVFFMIIGSTLILSGKEFDKEKDSNRIYAYSANIFALLSCILALITLVVSM